MIKLVRLLLATIGIIILVGFAVANRQIVEIGFWPFPQTLDLPVYGILMTGMFIGVILGGLAVWFGSIKSRVEGSRAKRRIEVAEAQAARREAEAERAAVDASRQRREALALEAPKA